MVKKYEKLEEIITKDYEHLGSLFCDDFDQRNKVIDEIERLSEVELKYAKLEAEKTKIENDKKTAKRGALLSLFPKVDIATLVAAGVSVAEIIMILKFESEGRFIHSKALSFLTKIK